MEKTCRTCESVFTVLNCAHEWACEDEGYTACEDHKTRETPLLVDELAWALRRLMRPTEDTMAWGFYVTVVKDRFKQAKRALARYKEEVGDAEDV